MADARSLLRAQRAARRINHPHASYTDSGKLTCAVCRDPIKSDAQWDAHVRGASHRQRLLAQQKARAAQQQAPEPIDDPSATAAGSGAVGKSKPGTSTDTPSDEALLAQIISGGGVGQKRKHSTEEDDEDTDMADAAPEDDAARSKRSKHDMATAVAAPAAINGSPMKRDSPDASKSSNTPPRLTRQISGTPSHGVEIQIPSRPATPSASATSAASTPKAAPMGRSPLIPQEAQPGGSKPAPKAAFVTPNNTGRAQNTTAAPATSAVAAAGAAAGGGAGNDDDDWAAFEAEVVHAAPTTTKPAAGFPNDTVISAAPLTADQLAAKSEEEEREKRRMQADVDIEDEKEEATRALETEFEEMEELEARVRKLKEKREAIRRGSVAAPASAAAGVEGSEQQQTQQSVNGAGDGIEEKDENEDEEEDDDEDDDEDDWAGFRFRA